MFDARIGVALDAQGGARRAFAGGAGPFEVTAHVGADVTGRVALEAREDATDRRSRDRRAVGTHVTRRAPQRREVVRARDVGDAERGGERERAERAGGVYCVCRTYCVCGTYCVCCTYGV